MTFNKDKEPGAYVDLNVNNLTQRFNSGTSKNTNWFVADGELSQYDEKLRQKRRSMLGHKILGEIQFSQGATVLINRFEDKSDHPLDGNYARFGGFGGRTLSSSPLPSVDIYLNTGLYEHIERAFIMPNPQIEFRLEFKQSIQYEGFTLTFNKPIENFELSYEDRFTLDCEHETGIWNAYCEMVEIKNLRD